MELLYKELSYEIIGLSLDIYNNYGSFHKEKVYQGLLKEKFDLQGIKYLLEPKITVYSQESNKKVGFYVPDFVIDGKIILELKATSVNSFRDEQQLLGYLKVSEFELGLLLNFGLKSFYFKRLIYTNDRKKITTKIS